MYVTETGVSIDSEEHRCYMVNSYINQVGERGVGGGVLRVGGSWEGVGG